MTFHKVRLLASQLFKVRPSDLDILGFENKPIDPVYYNYILG